MSAIGRPKQSAAMALVKRLACSFSCFCFRCFALAVPVRGTAVFAVSRTGRGNMFESPRALNSSQLICHSARESRNEKFSACRSTVARNHATAVGISPRCRRACCPCPASARSAPASNRSSPLTVAQIIEVRMDVTVCASFLPRFGLWLVSTRWWLSEIFTF